MLASWNQIRITALVGNGEKIEDSVITWVFILICRRLLMHFDVGLGFKLVVAFVINKIVPFQTLAGRVVLPLLFWWIIRYKLQLVFGVLHKFGWLLEMEGIDVFWFLYASWRISFCILAFS
tara:strand:+ start:102 stop:464 length:363 start_codon:yes stop_codon:yes gene_type:complete